MTPPTSTEPARAFVCLGSNIRPELHLVQAVERLVQALRVTGTSRVYESEAKGAVGAPRFLNAAVAIETMVEPRALKFGLLRPLERELGRVRTDDPNEPRTIDLDLALFGDLVANERDLVLPEPDILTCAHVAVPLADLAPDLRHPVTGEALGSIAEHLAGESDIRVVEKPRLALDATR